MFVTIVITLEVQHSFLSDKYFVLMGGKNIWEADQQIRLSVCLIQQVDLAKRGAQIIQYLSLTLSCQAVLGYI